MSNYKNKYVSLPDGAIVCAEDVDMVLDRKRNIGKTIDTTGLYGPQQRCAPVEVVEKEYPVIEMPDEIGPPEKKNPNIRELSNRYFNELYGESEPPKWRVVDTVTPGDLFVKDKAGYICPGYKPRVKKTCDSCVNTKDTIPGLCGYHNNFDNAKGETTLDWRLENTDELYHLRPDADNCPGWKERE